MGPGRQRWDCDAVGVLAGIWLCRACEVADRAADDGPGVCDCGQRLTRPLWGLSTRAVDRQRGCPHPGYAAPMRRSMWGVTLAGCGQPPRLEDERFHPLGSGHRLQGLVSNLSGPFTLWADSNGPWPDRRAGTEMKQWRRSGPSWKPGCSRSTGV